MLHRAAGSTLMRPVMIAATWALTTFPQEATEVLFHFNILMKQNTLMVVRTLILSIYYALSMPKATILHFLLNSFFLLQSKNLRSRVPQ